MSDWPVRFRRVAYAISILGATALGEVRAANPAIVVTDSGPLGIYGGREYSWATGAMEGTVMRADSTVGSYRVPISIYYPRSGGNGFGLVDVVNTADFYSFASEHTMLGQYQVNYSASDIFSDFIRTEGFIYLAVQWSRTVTDVLGPDYGVIENGMDGYEIIRDAARLLRNPEAVIGLDQALLPVPWVIAHGTSGSAGVLRGYAWGGENGEADGSRVYDGFLLTSTSGQVCRFLSNDETPQSAPGAPSVATFQVRQTCAGPVPDAGKMIALRNQTEIEASATILPRDELPWFRVYEVPGTAHAPPFLSNLGFVGAIRQNPVSWQPVARAMLVHLVDWIVDGKEPPPPLYIDVAVGADGRARFVPDADGNALGGIRLPHLTTVLADGSTVGAPLGVYGGLDQTLNPALGYGYANQGGTFEPFPPEELARRYPTQEVYVDLVERAARALLDAGYILPEGYDSYVRAARRQRLTPLEDTVPEPGPAGP